MAGISPLSSSSHFAPMPYSNVRKPVALPPGRARLSTYPAPTGSGTSTKTTGTVRVICSNGPAAVLPLGRITSGASATSSSACLRMRGVGAGPAGVDPQVAAVGPTQSLQLLQERVVARLPFRIVRPVWHEHADTAHPLARLRARGERPRRRRAAEHAR